MRFCSNNPNYYLHFHDPQGSNDRQCGRSNTRPVLSARVLLSSKLPGGAATHHRALRIGRANHGQQLLSSTEHQRRSFEEVPAFVAANPVSEPYGYPMSPSSYRSARVAAMASHHCAAPEPVGAERWVSRQRSYAIRNTYDVRDGSNGGRFPHGSRGDLSGSAQSSVAHFVGRDRSVRFDSGASHHHVHAAPHARRGQAAQAALVRAAHAHAHCDFIAVDEYVLDVEAQVWEKRCERR
jgi:hypothetical protein